MHLLLQVDHLRDFILFRFSMGMIDNVIAKCKNTYMYVAYMLDDLYRIVIEAILFDDYYLFVLQILPQWWAIWPSADLSSTSLIPDTCIALTTKSCS